MNTQQQVIDADWILPPRYRISLVREDRGGSYRPDKPITNSDRVAEIIRPYFADLDREHVVIVMLDVKCQIIGMNTVSIGHLSGAPVTMRETFKAAILANAHAIIIVHNHPSGNVTPSDNDLEVTKQLIQAGQILGINVIDHIILGENDYTSIRTCGYVSFSNTD